MSENRSCPECGAAFVSEESRSLCPRCLMSLGLSGSRLAESASPPDSVATPRQRRISGTAWAVFIAVAAVSLAAAVFLLRSSGRGDNVRVIRFEIRPPEEAVFPRLRDGGNPALSPDGRLLAYTAALKHGSPRLWIRPLASFDSRVVEGSEGAAFPFWSPDSRMVAFFAGGKLKKVGIEAGMPQTLCEARDGQGGAWSRTGVIVFSPNRRGGLYQVSAAGGVPTQVTKLDRSRGDARHSFPVFLPDGLTFLYTRLGRRTKEATVLAGRIDSVESRTILQTGGPVAYVPPVRRGLGQILFLNEGLLFAQPFDAHRVELAGEATPIAVGLETLHATIGFSASEQGVLAWRAGDANLRLAIIDRTGREQPLEGPEGDYGWISLSPDSRTVALEAIDSRTGGVGIWLRDLRRGVQSRLRSFDASDWSPVWSPDGRRIAFLSDQDRSRAILQMAVDEARAGERLAVSDEIEQLGSWSADGRFLAYSAASTRGDQDLWVVPLEGNHKPAPLVATPFDETDPQFSPDARWVAYSSNESGQWEVYVRSFPASPTEGMRRQVSTAGGRCPRWRGDGREIFYVADDGALMAARVVPAAAFDTGPPERLAKLFPRVGYAVVPDGSRILTLVPASPGVSSIRVVSDWTASIGR
jgi:Tol biopolymer transport system component